MSAQDLTSELQQRLQQAIASHTPVRVVGADTKAFYGLTGSANVTLSVQAHQGVIAYEPSELVIRVRSGTTVREITTLLAEQGQMLAFEPPMFDERATIGGTLACGFAGPRRPFAGSARDFVLGCRLLNGRAEVVNFGGQVIKNVAGFDVSRLMVGALGQLGIILDISLRVLPRPAAELTLCHHQPDPNVALAFMQRWQRQPWPLSGLCYVDQSIRVRLSGASSAISAVAKQLGGELDSAGALFWEQLREQQLAFFQGPEKLWRLSVPPATPMLDLEGRWLLDWGGAQRWLKSSLPAATIHQLAKQYGGYALCFRGDEQDWLRFEPELLALQQQVRQAFDPGQLINPHRFSAVL